MICPDLSRCRHRLAPLALLGDHGRGARVLYMREGDGALTFYDDDEAGTVLRRFSPPDPTTASDGVQP